MANIIEEAAVRVLPELSGFRANLRRQLAQETNGINAKVGIEADTTQRGINGLVSSINRAAREAQRRAKPIKLDVEIDQRSLDRELRRISNRRQKIIVDVEYRERNRPTPPGGGSGGSGGGSGGGGGSFFGRTSGAVKTGIGVGAALLSPTTAAAAGLTATLGAATAGVTAFGVTAAFQFANAKKQLDAFNKGLITFNQLPESLRGIIPVLNQFSAQYNGFLSATSKPIFDTATRAIQTFGAQLPGLVPVINSVAGGVDVVLTQFQRLTNGSAVKGFLSTIQSQAPQAIETLGSIGTNFAGGLLTAFTRLAPAGQGILNTINTLSQKFASFTSGDGFTRLVEYVEKEGPQVIELISKLASLGAKLFAALAPIGTVALNVANGLAGIANALPTPVITTFLVTLALFKTRLLGLSIISGITASFRSFGNVLTATRFQGVAGGLTAIRGEARGAATALKGMGANLAIGASLAIITGFYDAYNKSRQEVDEQLQAHKANIIAVSDAWNAAAGSVDGYTNKEKLHQFQATDIDVGGNGLTRFLNGRGTSVPKDTLYNISQRAGINQADLLAGSQGNDAAKQKVDAAFDAHIADLQNKRTFSSSTKERQQLDDEISLQTRAKESYDRTAVSLKDVTDQRTRDAAAAGSQNTTINGVTSSMDDAADKANTLAAAFQRLIAPTQDQQIADHFKGIAKQYNSLIDSRNDAQQQVGDTAEQTADSAKSAFKAIGSAQEAYARSQRSYTDAVQAEKDAHDRLKDSIKGVADAREQARRGLRDSTDNVESARIRVQQAAEQELLTRGLSGDNLQRRQALLEQKNAGEDLSDILKDNKKEYSQGVEGTTLVKNAKKQVTQDEKGYKDAIQATKDALKAQKDAAQTVVDTQAAYHRELRNGARARAAAEKHYKDAKQEVDDYYGSLSSVDRTFLTTLKIDGVGKVLAGVKQVTDAVQAAYVLAANPTLDPTSALKAVQNGVKRDADNKVIYVPYSPTRDGQGNAIKKASGGAVRGSGGSTSDSIHMLASNDEHVWTSKEVRAAGGHNAVAEMRRGVLRRATGGPVNFPAIGLNIGASTVIQDALVSGLRQQALQGVGGGTGGGPADSSGYTGGAYGSGQTWQDIISVSKSAKSALGFIPNVTAISPNVKPFHSRTGGYHDVGEAVDFSNHPGDYGIEDVKMAQWWLSNYGAHLSELFHTPQTGPGIYIKKGVAKTASQIGRSIVDGHRDHVHVAAAPGALQAGGLSSAGLSSGNSIFDFFASLGAGTKASQLSGLLNGSTGGSAGGGGPASGKKPLGSINVIQTAESTARAMGASNRFLLSLMETGYVESGMRNLNYGDRDSKGFLQQRPSQGWKNATDVAGATKDYINTAKRFDRGQTAGELAADVQRPRRDLRGKYALRRGDAYNALNYQAPTIPAGVYDTGGILAPGTAAINMSSSPELVLNNDQIKALGSGKAFSDADLRRLAYMIAAALENRGGVVKLGEKVVGEVVRQNIADILSL